MAALAAWNEPTISADHCNLSAGLGDPLRLSVSGLRNWAALGRNRR
jgi:hypothetical protein